MGGRKSVSSRLSKMLVSEVRREIWPVKSPADDTQRVNSEEQWASGIVARDWKIMFGLLNLPAVMIIWARKRTLPLAEGESASRKTFKNNNHTPNKSSLKMNLFDLDSGTVSMETLQGHFHIILNSLPIVERGREGSREDPLEETEMVEEL